jgi:hypothetical protein
MRADLAVGQGRRPRLLAPTDIRHFGMPFVSLRQGKFLVLHFSDISQSALQSSYVLLRRAVLFILSQRASHGLKVASPLQ